MNTSIGMIAHDFTGALDSLVAFVETPGDTIVLLRPEDTVGDAKNIAVVAETQALSPAEAYTNVRDAARQLAGRQLFKRVSSSLRGNIGPEIRAVIDETGAKAIVCSALPREGRTVIDGIGRLNSIPLHLTEYGRDPTAPCLESSLPAILRDSGIDVSSVSLDVVRRGEEALRENLLASTSEAVVVDAETDGDLRTIGWALVGLDTSWCACAASGLSPHLAAALGQRGKVKGGRHLHLGNGGILAVIGSTDPTSAAQVARLVELHGTCVVRIEAPALCAGGPEVARWEEEVVHALACGRNAVLTTSLSVLIPHLRSEVAPRLGELAARVIGRDVSALVLSGGMTALKTCRALGLASVQVLGEIEPGVVCSRGTDRDGIERTIVSKAGGFGDKRTLARLMGAGQGLNP